MLSLHFFNYGLDTGTVWKSVPFHEPILWRHISISRQSPDRDGKEQSRWGWLFYRRVKTGKTFYRPMNHTVHEDIKAIMPESCRGQMIPCFGWRFAAQRSLSGTLLLPPSSRGKTLRQVTTSPGN